MRFCQCSRDQECNICHLERPSSGMGRKKKRSLQLRRVIQPWQSCDLHEPLWQVTVLSAEERNTFGQKCHEKNHQINCLFCILGLFHSANLFFKDVVRTHYLLSVPVVWKSRFMRQSDQNFQLLLMAVCPFCCYFSGTWMMWHGLETWAGRMICRLLMSDLLPSCVGGCQLQFRTGTACVLNERV